MVLGKLPVPGRPTNWDKSMARAYCACSRCGWGWFGHFSHLSGVVGWFNGPLRQYFSLYRAISQREGERGEIRVNVSKQPLPAPTTSTGGPCPTVIQIVGRPSAGSLPSTIAPPDHPLHFLRK